MCAIDNSNLRDSKPLQMEDIVASTKMSELLGVEAVFGEDLPRPASPAGAARRGWAGEVSDYLEDPHRHFRFINELRRTVEWPRDAWADEVKEREAKR
ncbi:hypothetical protein TeGR_g4261, partial [Tetraparma gracilis]